MRQIPTKTRTRLLAASLLGLALLAPTNLSAQAKPLYEAVVVGEESIVRSGPGVTHYGTDRLPPRTKVQVYREDPGGWMAIRPPEGSFSLIQLSDLELLSDNVAEVTQQDAVAWVGTRLTAVNKPMWQVRLRKGETVRVLGKVDRDKFNLTDDEPDWVQIAPPAGEFRWIAGKNIKARRQTSSADQQPLDRQVNDQDIDRMKIDFDRGPTSNTPQPFDDWESNNSTRTEFGSPSNSASPNSQRNDGDWAIDVEDNESAGWKPASQTISKFVEQRSRFVSDIPGGTGGNNFANDSSSNYGKNSGQDFSSNSSSNNDSMNARSNIFDASDSFTGASQFASDPTTQSGPTLLTPTLNSPNLQNANSSAAVAQRLAASLPAGHPIRSLELALSNEMAGKSPAEWNLEQLARQAQQLRNQTTNSNETLVLDHIQQKINNCRQIKAGYKAVDDDSLNLQTARPGNRFGAIGSGPIRNGNASGTATDNGLTASTNNDVLLNYDASGYLAELVRDNGTSPSTYVLKDDRGRITHHVAAPPGLNLRRYLNRQVGIIGNRGYNKQLRLEHVTAERITTVRR